jgi:hypothetical protein
VWAVPRLCEFYPGICLTTEGKARKNLSQGKKNRTQVKKNLSQSTVYILPKTPAHYKTLTNTHINALVHIRYCLFSYRILSTCHRNGHRLFCVNSCTHHNLDEHEFALSLIRWTVKCFGKQNGCAARQVCTSAIVKRGCEKWKRGEERSVGCS